MTLLFLFNDLKFSVEFDIAFLFNKNILELSFAHFPS